MKRVVICGVQTLFVSGGAEILVQTLQRELEERGFTTDIVNLPFKDVPRSEILKSFLMWRFLHLLEMHGQRIDLVIGTKFPSYAARHPNKVVWLVHQHRQAYELYGTPYSDMHTRLDGKIFRYLVRWMDRVSLSEAKGLFAISRNAANRLLRYNGLAAKVLYHPPKLWDMLHTDGYGDYMLAVGRLEPIKRLDLVIRAMAQVKGSARCIVVGDGIQRAELEKLSQTLGLDDKVRFVGRVGDEELVKLYAGCRGVIYAPYDEDYGYVTAEAFLSKKPVISTTDSGGVLEFLEDGISGYVVPPLPDAIADRVANLLAHSELSRSYGESGYEKVKRITWGSVIGCLTEGLS